MGVGGAEGAVEGAAEGLLAARTEAAALLDAAAVGAGWLGGGPAEENEDCTTGAEGGWEAAAEDVALAPQAARSAQQESWANGRRCA